MNFTIDNKVIVQHRYSNTEMKIQKSSVDHMKITQSFLTPNHEDSTRKSQSSSDTDINHSEASVKKKAIPNKLLLMHAAVMDRHAIPSMFILDFDDISRANLSNQREISTVLHLSENQSMYSSSVYESPSFP